MSRTRRIDQIVADATIEIACMPEDIPVRGNAMVSGDDAADRRAEDKILSDLEWNEWAWCSVRVTARPTVDGLGDIVGTDVLGGCSYASEAEFCQPGGYYDDMIDIARSDLRDRLSIVSDALLDGVE